MNKPAESFSDVLADTANRSLVPELRGELVAMKDGIAQVKILDPMPNVTGSFRVVVDGGLASADGVVFSGSSEPDYTKEVDDILSVLRESWMSDDDFSELLTIIEMAGMSRKKMAADLATGVANGFSIERQVEISKAILLGSKTPTMLDEGFMNAIRKFGDKATS